MLFLRKIAIFALRITGRRVGDGPGEMPEWSIGPHSKCGVRATVPGVRIPLSPQMTGRSVGLQTNVCNLFYFRGGQICPERFGIVRSADGRRPGIGRDMWLFGRSREGGPQLDLCLVCRKLGKVIIRGFEIDYPVTDEMFARPE